MYPKHPLCLAVGLVLVLPALAPAHAQSVAAVGGALHATDLDRIEVRPQYESQMRAIDYKRDADAIQDTVSSDAMGQYPDKNVADSLQRIPGVSVTRDQGEGRFVVVRGLDAALNSVRIDGISVGTPEGDTRAAPLDVFPSDSTERLTVVKAPTPDMPGDSIGGAIVVESASAFDRDGRSIRAKVEASHQALSGETSPKVAFNYSDIFGGRFGVAFGANWQDRDFESDNVEAEYDAYDDTRPDDLIPVEVQQRKYYVNRERLGLNLNLDWNASDASRYFLRTLFSDFTDAETRQRSILPFGEGDVTAEGAGMYRIEGIGADEFRRRVRFRTKEENTFATSFGGEHRLNNAMVDYRLGYTKTRERVDDEVEARFKYDADDDLSARVRVGQGLPRYEVIDPSGDGWLRNAHQAFDRLVVSPIQVDDDERSAAVNIRFDGNDYSIKAGLLGRWRERMVNVDEAELRLGPAIDLASWSSAAPSHRNAVLGDGIDSGAMRRYLRENLSRYSARPRDVAANTEVSLAEDYSAREDILAAYLMGTWDLGDLRVIGGLRAESTRFDASGYLVDLEDEETIGSVTARETSSRYTNVLPGLHLRYANGNGWYIRGAYTHTLSRPAFGDISPRMRINHDEEEISVGNTALDPYKSRNLDLSFERYIGDSGIVSLGVFHKNIEGYIAEVVTRGHADFPGFPGYEVTMPVNGDDAEVFGLEFNWQQQLDFLPGAWSGLLVGVSGTWLDTEFSLPERPGEKFGLPLSSDRLYSAHVGYEKQGFSARLAAVHRSDYLDSISGRVDPGAGSGVDPVALSRRYDVYVAANTQLDLSLEYRFNSRWGLYFEASNLLDEPLELYQGSSAYTLQNELYGRTYAIGLKVKL